MLNNCQKRSFKILALFSVLLLLLLAGRLYQLQIVEAPALSDLSASNSQRLLHLSAPRGQIYSADGQLLTGNQLVFVIKVQLSEGQNRDQLAQRLAAVIQDAALPAARIGQILAQHSRRYQPVEIARYHYEQGLPIISRLEEQRAWLPGLQISEEALRFYPQGRLAGHLLGNVGAIDAAELEQLRGDGYQATDWLGKTGLEKSLESWPTAAGDSFGLRGQPGIEQVEVTASQRKLRTIFVQPALAGQDFSLTIESQLQRALEQSLAATVERLAAEYPKCDAGAAVMIEVKTGAVLAMASYPSFDPNDFAAGLSAAHAAYYWDEDLSPSLNRAISALYPPGSVFKPVTALAILEAGIAPTETVLCTAAAWSDNDGQARCTAIHGEINLYQAMAHSCNTYFQEMGQKIGVAAIIQTARTLGLGAKSGIELPHELAGTLPTPAWKAAQFQGWEQEWHLYDTYYTAMGQGYTTVTPLQIAVYAATIANDGRRMRPYLVAQIKDRSGQLLYQAQPELVAQVDLPSRLFAELRQAMCGVTDAGGTGYTAFADFPCRVAGKSGTAQTGLPGDEADHHGLFLAFAPAEAPQVAVACVIEYGQTGGGSAAYVCRDALAAYFAAE